MFRLFLLFIFFTTTLLSNETSRSIVFAPQILNDSRKAAEFYPLFKYIEKISGIKTNFIFEKNYSTILEKFNNDQIDITFLGPLPLVKLSQKNKNYQPIITFIQKDGQTTYSCVLTKFENDKLDFNKKIRVALTQALSTCGYYMSSKLLSKEFNIKLEEQKFAYTKTHGNALLKVLENKFDIAGAKDDVAKEFESLGMKIIAKSKPLPGFSLVVNTKTLSKKQIKLLQELILSIPKSTYSKWKGVLNNGFAKVDKSLYEALEVDFSSIPKTGNMKEGLR